MRAALLAALLGACDPGTQPDLGGAKPPGPSPFTPAPVPPNLPDAPAPQDPVVPAPPPVVAPAISGIYIADSSGAGARLLVAGEWPAWSPDGSRLAFQRGDSVRIIDADGNGERAIARGREPTWSPDGQQIAFAGNDGLAIVRVDGSERQLIVPHDFRDDTWAESDAGVGTPSWSPDGSTLVFGHLGDGETEPAQLFLVHLFAGTPVRVTDYGRARYAESSPTWSAAGDEILFWSYGHGIALTVPGGQARSLYLNFPAVSYWSKPVWLPDGVSVAFTAGRVGSGPEIWVLRPDGQVRALIAGARDAVWSPDGGRIAFVRTQ